VPGIDHDEIHEWNQELMSCLQVEYKASERDVFALHFHIWARSLRAIEETGRIHCVVIARLLGYNPPCLYPDLEEGVVELGEGFDE
jgi:hypothetical protein